MQAMGQTTQGTESNGTLIDVVSITLIGDVVSITLIGDVVSVTFIQ